MSTNTIKVSLYISMLSISTGCSYMQNRVRDFQDCFKLSAGAGYGLYTGLTLGPVKLDAGYWQGYSAGTDGDCGFYSGSEIAWGIPFPIGILSSPIVAIIDRRPGSGFRLLGFMIITSKNYIDYSYADRIAYYKDRDKNDIQILNLFPLPNEYDIGGTWEHNFWIEVEFYCFVGIRIGFNIAEFADFLLGFIGIDICNDDYDPKGRAINHMRKWLERGYTTDERKPILDTIVNWINMDNRIEFIDEIVAMLQNRSEYIRMDGISALSRLSNHSEHAIPPLIEALKDGHMKCKICAIRALAKYGTDASIALPHLGVLLNHRDEYVRSAAEKAIESIRNN